jgi:glutathione S-transferase
MSDGTLYIGHRRYSSWSLRGWLTVRLAKLDVEEVLIPFVRPGPTPAIAALSPNGLVPYLEHKGAKVWESMAICDYCAEIDSSLWPAGRIARAHARSVSAEMHAGFRDLRMAMWMNLCRDFSPHGRTPGALENIASVTAVRSCSVRPSARPTQCMPQWSGVSWDGNLNSQRHRKPIAMLCGRTRW